MARTRAGALYLEAGDDAMAETMLEDAMEHAQTANMPLQEREIAPLLFQARLYEGSYYEILKQAEETLRTQAEDALPDLLLQLYSGRAEAKEALGDEEGALTELGTVLELLPRDLLYERIGIRCGRARMFASRAQWGVAREELDRATDDLAAAADSARGDGEKKRAEALVKLVRANVHQDLGEDAQADELYEECERIFTNSGDTALLLRPTRFQTCKLYLWDFGLGATSARLRDHLNASPEHRRIGDKENTGITALTAGRLAEARTTLLQAITAAQRVHDTERERGLRFWYADVLLAAGDGAGALRQYVFVGDAEKSREVTKRLVASVPGEPPSVFDELVAYIVSEALWGSLHARRAAFVALTTVADLLPEGLLETLAAGLSSMDEWPAGSWADRNVLSEAGELAQKVAPMVGDAQALAVGRGVVRALLRTDCFHTTYRPLCSALSSISVFHPGVVGELGVPHDRLVELVGGDLINDTRNAMATLVNLARIGDIEAKEKALELARSGDTPWHVRWKRWLGDASEEELSSTIREVLGRGCRQGSAGRRRIPPWHRRPLADVLPRLGPAGRNEGGGRKHPVESGLRQHREHTGSLASGDDARQKGRPARRRGSAEGHRVPLPLLAHEVEVHPVARSIDDPCRR